MVFLILKNKVPLEETDSARGVHTLLTFVDFDILGTIHSPEFFKLNECDRL